jgi:Ca2+-binding EF-hand superfamily protein
MFIRPFFIDCGLCGKKILRGRKRWNRHIDACKALDPFLRAQEAAAIAAGPSPSAAPSENTAVPERERNRTSSISHFIQKRFDKLKALFPDDSDDEPPDEPTIPPESWICANCTSSHPWEAPNCDVCHEKNTHPLAEAHANDTTEEIVLAHAECSICLDDLCLRPCAMFCNRRRKRKCRHVLHKDCIDSLQNKICPLCRTRYSKAILLPDPSDQPSKWFKYVDFDRTGKLSKSEVYDALRAQLPLDDAKLEVVLESTLWDKWDHDKSGVITEEEFFHPTEGLFQFILRNRERLTMEETTPIPSLLVSKTAWFSYWDDDDSGELSLQQMMRALRKTLNAGNDPNVAHTIHDMGAVSFLFDATDSGGVSFDEFNRADTGLGDIIIACLNMSSNTETAIV